MITKIILFAAHLLVSVCLADDEKVVDDEEEIGKKNPYEKGCLIQSLPDQWTKLRVCNSHDRPDAASLGLCRSPPMDYPEVRIFSQNWESIFFTSWILQIVLSELLDVPVSIETGNPNITMNFYDAQGGGFQYPASQGLDAIEKALQMKDCRYASRDPSNYEFCLHVIAEVWEVQLIQRQNMVYRHLIEPLEGIGMLGQESWFVPHFTAENDPSLLTYLGLQGEKNRQKLAETFLRPTTWKDYCDIISPTHCQTADTVAKRAPMNESEYSRMFIDGLYTGYFRKTEKNDCDRNPANCTGHIADYPCGWSSYVGPLTHYLTIALEGDGDEPYCKGYSYSQLPEIWRAANATKSNVMMVWWAPEALYQEFQGTDAAFVRINLPPPTQTCLEHRIQPEDRCSDDFERRIGPPAGVCGDPLEKILYKVVSKSLYDLIYDPTIPDAIRSPAYEFLDVFAISEFRMDEIFHLWLNTSDPRRAICEWISNNMDYAQSFVPRSYPRTLKEESANEVVLYHSLVLGGIAAILVIGTAWLVHLRRGRQAIKFAQIDFLYLLLAGCTTVSIGAIVIGVPATDASCVAEVWLINLGYTLELVPLIIKVAAVNKIVQASQKMKRVVLRRTALFRAVIFISVLVVLFVMIWTIVDSPKKESEYELTDFVDADGYRLVHVRYYCRSKNKAWILIAVGWNAFLLLCATILAFQMRGLSSKRFGESSTLAFLIYSHFVFVVVRLITYFLSSVSEWLLARCRSLIFSADMIMTVLIYFLPKLFGADEIESRLGSRTCSNMRLSTDFQPPPHPPQPQLPPVIIRWISNLSSISHYFDEESESSVQAFSSISHYFDEQSESSLRAFPEEKVDRQHSTFEENKSDVGKLFDVDEGSCDSDESSHLPTTPPLTSVSAVELQHLRGTVAEQNETISLLKYDIANLMEKLQLLSSQLPEEPSV